MKLVIEIGTAQAVKLREFIDAATAPVKAKSIPRLDLKLSRGGVKTEIFFVPGKIWAEGLPPTFAVGDVVENERSGNWGRIIKIDGEEVTIKCSKQTAKELKRETFTSHIEDLSQMI